MSETREASRRDNYRALSLCLLYLRCFQSSPKCIIYEPDLVITNTLERSRLFCSGFSSTDYRLAELNPPISQKGVKQWWFSGSGARCLALLLLLSEGAGKGGRVL